MLIDKNKSFNCPFTIEYFLQTVSAYICCYNSFGYTRIEM